MPPAYPKHMLSDLAASGLGASDARRLGLSYLDVKEAQEATDKAVGDAYSFPYYDLGGCETGFIRLKLFDAPKFRGKLPRYWQPPQSAPRLYFPRLIAWQKVQSQPQLEVWVTEGEKKAASLAKLGVPCVAVSGVWAWTSKRHHLPLLPDFKALGLDGRPLVLCFDSDAKTNVQVGGALAALALELERHGAAVRLCYLPELVAGKKTGLDDFLVHHGKAGLSQLAQLPKEPLGLSAALRAMNAECFYVEEQQAFFHLKTFRFINSAHLFIHTVFANRTVQVPGRDGALKAIGVAEEWVRWEQRRVVSRLVYAPGEPAELPDGGYNLWRGWGCVPKRGDARLLDELIDFITADVTPEQRRWFWQWLACPLQRPGTKLYSAVLLYSHYHGTGKTILGYFLRGIYGDNAVEVSQEQLHSAFNEWARCRQLVIGDEITGSDRRQDADRLKHMITRERVIVNQKYQPTYELLDCCNYYLTTNQPDAVYIEAKDRRHFVLEVKGQPLSNKFYQAFDRWYKSPAGLAAGFQRLLDVDLTGFAPTAPAPETEAKKAMHQVSGTEADAVVRDMLRDPTLLRVGDMPVGRGLFTLAELQVLLDPSGRLGRQQLGRALRRHGAPPPFIIATGGTTKAVYAVQDFDKWVAASHAERVAHYEQREVQQKRRRKKLNGA